MHWRAKAHLQNVIARLPFADQVYYAIQRHFGNLRPGQHDPMPWYDAVADLVDWVESAGRSVEGRAFVEIGTGRRLDLPTALWLWGARRTLTVDVHRYVSGALVVESLCRLQADRERLEERARQARRPSEWHARLDRLMAFSGDLAAFLSFCGIDYMAPVDPARLPLPDHSADVLVTHVVLQHVPPEGILRILAEARRVLVRGGLLVHFIDLTDMFSHDGSVPAIHFLQFASDEWHRLTGNRFMYQNRLRASDYERLFERAGMRVLRSRYAVDARSLALLESGRFRLAPELISRPPEDLAGSHLRVLGTFDPPK